jgi:hypothetical protein
MQGFAAFSPCGSLGPLLRGIREGSRPFGSAWKAARWRWAPGLYSRTGNYFRGRLTHTHDEGVCRSRTISVPRCRHPADLTSQVVAHHNAQLVAARGQVESIAVAPARWYRSVATAWDSDCSRCPCGRHPDPWPSRRRKRSRPACDFCRRSQPLLLWAEPSSPRLPYASCRLQRLGSSRSGPAARWSPTGDLRAESISYLAEVSGSRVVWVKKYPWRARTW